MDLYISVSFYKYSSYITHESYMYVQIKPIYILLDNPINELDYPLK